MNRLSVRVWIGAGLVLLGLVMLLERFGVVRGLTSLFWGLAFAIAAAFFLYRFVTNMRSEWWAAIPGFALLGLAAETLLAPVMRGGGYFFLGGLGLAFFAVYFSDRQRWWAIIPGGVMVSLSVMTALSTVFGGRDTGGLFLIGLGLTFLLVAVLASLQWAWIPGIILLVLGAFIGTPFLGAMNLIWPAALILGGLMLILQFARKR